jgi:hypothetical protein
VSDPNRLDGIGVQQGPLRPDWGDGWADLVCDRCGAGWTGIIGEPCWWCERTLELMRAEQVERSLRPPDIAVDDERYERAMIAWGKRLRDLVAADIITEQQARTAWERHAKRVAA